MLLRHAGFRRLCDARDRLAEPSEAAPSIADLAREARLSPSHFIHQFEALFGSTPHQFRIAARIDLAKRLLADGNDSVTDVCMEVGFSSLGSFSTLFLTRVGENPSAYRRRVRTVFGLSAIDVRSSAIGHRTSTLALYPGCLTLMAHLPPSESIFREAPDSVDR
jgi:AraC-like DNA-binding protein